MTTIMKISSRNLSGIRRRSLVKGGMAGIIGAGMAPTFARAEAKKLTFAHINAVPESAAVAFDWMAGEVRKQSNGELDMQNKLLPRWSMVYVEPEEDATEIRAGAKGLELLVMQFPKDDDLPAQAAA